MARFYATNRIQISNSYKYAINIRYKLKGCYLHFEAKDKQGSTGFMGLVTRRFLLESFIEIYDESVNGTRHI